MNTAYGYRLWAAVAAGLAALVVTTAPAQAAGLLKAKGNENVGAFIRSHQVNVTLNNGFARTEVDQVFGNKTDRDFEAIYTFPVPKQASFSELSLWIDGREVVGEVVEKEKARKAYEEQVAKGNDTALAEKNEFKTFDVSVGRVRAGQDTRVRLVYYQPLEIDLNVGRYLYPLAEGGVDEERIAFWSVDDKVREAFSFDLTLKSAFPVKDVRMPGYEGMAQIARTSATNAAETAGGEVYRAHLATAEGGSLSKDLVFYYRLSETTPARVELIPYRANANEPGTFMVVVTPGADLKPLASGSDWVFVLDQSGSMSGGKIATLADGVSRVMGKMSPNDRFHIVTFNDSAHDLTGGMIPATPENVQKWIATVKGIQANGSTALFSGLEMAYRGLDADRTTGIILVTDGVCNVGPTAHSTFQELCRRCDIRLFTFVIGNSANQPLMDMLARETSGFAMNISESDDIYGRLLQAKAKVLNQSIRDVKLTFHGERVKDLTPDRLHTLYMGQQLVAFGHYTGSGDVEVELTGRIAGQDQKWTTRAVLPDRDTDNPELERLWALSQIDELTEQIRQKGETSDLRDAVARLGVDYSLVTDYTSMLVVRDDQAEGLGLGHRNADRVQRERTAQQQRETAPVRNYRVDNTGSNPSGGAFRGVNAPSVGTGPVGPLFVIAAVWLASRRKGTTRT
jgi:Ca-activated chloride channel family protein